MKTLLHYGWIAFAVGLCIGLTAVIAFAHGDAAWIMQYGYRDNRGIICCNETDCAVAQPGEIKRINGGWLHVPTNTTLMDGDKGIHQSRDAQVWRCVPHGKMNCLFLSAGI